LSNDELIKEYENKLALFESGLKEIESKNMKWFKLRKPNPDVKGQEHDMLENHYYLMDHFNQSILHILPESELPIKIKHEMKQLFRKYFPKE